ncbi:hypothetical protein VNO78_34105 [Psophocarpus tetragonolobus]|uniref:Uncharacterized protein n=1 Tax=Psophocarpus tetragonolobus TaxID=3891 RepID=A0AAN9P245_PSOTE
MSGCRKAVKYLFSYDDKLISSNGSTSRSGFKILQSSLNRFSFSNAQKRLLGQNMKNYLQATEARMIFVDEKLSSSNSSISRSGSKILQ